MTKKIVIAGMPGSGKTTFISALRHILVSDEVETSLKLTGLSDAEQHLNTLEKEWIACSKVGRTKQLVEEWVSFHVREVATETLATILVPDFSGEAFRRPAATGQCKKTVQAALADLDGLLLFTNAARGDDDTLITTVQELLDGEESSVEEIVPFNPIDMPEESLLVELLQIFNRAPAKARRRKLALIASAWDDVEAVDKSQTPDQWFFLYRPMLSQFLECNGDLWDVQVYGVSAQGGKLPRDRDLLGSMVPSERVRIVGHAAKSHDITAPIGWLMSSPRS